MTNQPVKMLPSIYDYIPLDPTGQNNTLVKITLSNGEVLYARLDGSSEHWILDPALTPRKISVVVSSLGARALKIETCSIGAPIFIRAIDLPDYLFYCLTSKGTVVELEAVQRTEGLVPSTLDYELSSR